MEAFLFAVLKNLLVSAALAYVSSAFARPKTEGLEAPSPAKQDFAPTADEGTELKHFFGTGPAELLIVWVGDQAADPIVR